jgi:hypothetical protein
LTEVLQDHPDYKLFISGHSLGGALCQLFAFQLAAHVKEAQLENTIPLPIRALSFASPHVGNRAYARGFQAMEEAGLVRHIRFTNEGDIVPVGTFGFGYSQTGVNIYFRRGERRAAEVSYSTVARSVFSQLSFESVECHMMSSYTTRFMRPINKPLHAKTIDQLYEQHAGLSRPVQEKANRIFPQ